MSRTYMPNFTDTNNAQKSVRFTELIWLYFIMCYFQVFEIYDNLK
jgi:hypothetical protein